MKKLISTSLVALLGLNALIPATFAADAPEPTPTAITSEQATPTLEGVSPWAEKQVKAAIAKKIVPAALEKDYQKALTREEFCELMMTMMAQKNNTTVKDLMNHYPTPRSLIRYSDTENESVIIASYLGIVKGIGDDKFAPEKSITRQEAAVMLLNTINRLYGDVPATLKLFSYEDRAEIASWAEPAIQTLANIQGPDGRIMQGDSAGHFNPLENITREQGIAIALRIFTLQDLPQK